jgi:hypothetical protein
LASGARAPPCGEAVDHLDLPGGAVPLSSRSTA